MYVAPTSAKYKVYIIDEVHMLTREAFNALLKTLEEPPAHVVFILATTDAHKLPATIISRTQRFSFKPVAKDEVADHLSGIAKQEKIKVSNEALELLAEHGEGSFRDSISLLDQAGNQGAKIEADDVRQLLGMPPSEAIQQLLESLAGQAAPADIMNRLTVLYDQGYQAAAIAKQLGQLLRAQMVNDQAVLQPEQTLSLLQRLIEVPSSRDPERLLEIVLLEALPGQENDHLAAQPPAAPIKKKLTNPEPSPSKTVTESPKPEKPVSTEAKTVSKKVGKPLDAAVWPEVLAALKQKHNTLYGIVRMAQPEFRPDGTLELAFAFAFHQKRLNEAGNRQKLTDTIHDLSGQVITVECIVDQTAEPPAVVTPAAKTDSGDLATISNIFGGGELLES